MKTKTITSTLKKLLIVTLLITIGFSLLTDKFKIKLYASMHCENSDTKYYNTSTRFLGYKSGYQLYCNKLDRNTLMYFESDTGFRGILSSGSKSHISTSFDIGMGTYVLDNWGLFNLFEPVLENAVQHDTKKTHILYGFNRSVPKYVNKEIN